MVKTELAIDTGYGNAGKAEQVTLEVDDIPTYVAADVEIYSIERNNAYEWEVTTSAGYWVVDRLKLEYFNDNGHFRFRYLKSCNEGEEIIKKYCLRQCDPEEVDE